MTFGKASALACGFVGAMALGVWVGPHLTRERAVPAAPATVARETSAPADASPGNAVRKAQKVVPRRAAEAPVAMAIPASEPSLHERLKPLLNRGADMSVAAAGFGDGEQFAAIAHASRNTHVPFMVLKHRVLSERKTLMAAIQESDPRIDAGIEARRALAEAKSDIAALRS